nr:hypothetical protein CFP56_44981 [Quercus suber]
MWRNQYVYLSPSNPAPRALPPPEGGVSNPTPQVLPPPKGGVLDSTKSASGGSTTLYIGGGRRHTSNGVIAGQCINSGVVTGSPALGLDIGGRFPDLDLDIDVGPRYSGPVVGARAPDLDLDIFADGGLQGPQDWTTSISYVLRKLKSHKKIF